jgi:ribosomal-protein-alanine N-acetyltransferase
MEQNKTKIYTPFESLSHTQSQNVVNFLYTHLQEYGDEKRDIKKAVDYAMKEISSVGGYVITNYSQTDEIIGAVVVNKTGMGGYIPENILVYIAIHKDFRGKGIGKKLMQNALKFADGDFALHVESDNPAKFLYEKLGFENKYLEMRYKK